MRIALLQVSVDAAEPMPARIERVGELVRAQRGADLVVLPELWAHGAFASSTWAGTAESLDGATVKVLRTATADIGVHVHMGSIIERAPDGRLYNTSVLLGPDGDILTTYRKIHRFGFSRGEVTQLAAGADVVAYDGALGRVGLATCYDLRFPELFRALVDRGAELLILASSWPDTRIAHWRLLAQARAVENQMLVAACNAVGTHAGVTLGGHSLVIDPWGQILGEAGEAQEALTVDADLDLVAATRERFPVLPDRVLR